MKFETYIHKTVKIYHKIFHKDPCTHAHTQGVNVRARIVLRRNMRGHIYASFACMCAWIFTKNLLMIFSYLMNRTITITTHTNFSDGSRDFKS